MDEILGVIKLFAGTFTPRGYAACEGQLLAIAQNSALFSIVGTTYGGDGQTKFQLPKLPAPAGTRYMICVEGIYPSRD
jgi:microcystin-dependent protein